MDYDFNELLDNLDPGPQDEDNSEVILDLSVPCMVTQTADYFCMSELQGDTAEKQIRQDKLGIEGELFEQEKEDVQGDQFEVVEQGVQEEGRGIYSLTGTMNGAEVFCKKETVFNDREGAKVFMGRFCKENKTAFVITSSSKKNSSNLIFSCKHGKKRPSTSSGKRPIQATVKKNCNAFIRFYVRVGGEVVLTDFNVTHNDHEINNDIFLQDYSKATPHSVEIIQQMMDGKSKIGNMETRLNSEGVYMSKKQIRYQVDKILGRDFDINKLGPFLKRIVEDGGNVKIDRYPDEKVRVLSISTKEMMQGYISSGVTTIQVDTTFGFDHSGHKLNAVLYRNPNSDRGEVAVLSFLADETAHSYEIALSSFEYMLRHAPAVILIDKVGVLFSKYVLFTEYKAMYNTRLSEASSKQGKIGI